MPITAAQKLEILRAIDDVENRTVSPFEAEGLIARVLGAVMGEEGYVVSQTGRSGDRGLDITATRASDTKYARNVIGVQFKYYSKPLQAEQIRALLGAAVLNNLDRAMLITTGGFTKAARNVINRELPIAIELLNTTNLREWVLRLEVETEADQNEVSNAVRVLSRSLATIVARNPRALDELEWRDLERMLAEIFHGMGFHVVLTPPSKDGGKDIVLRCTIMGQTRSYVVEVKHWRSGNRVGKSVITNFLSVIAHERRDGGVLLSSSGYAANAFAQLSEVERHILRFGAEEKIVGLCRTYVKVSSEIWSPPEKLPELLYEGTL